MLKSQINRRNNLLRWCIIIGFAFFSILLLFILYIDLDLLRDPSIVTDQHIRILLIAMATIASILLIRKMIDYMASALNHKYFKRFSEIAELGIYSQSKTKVYGGNGTATGDHAILLLHGFTCSPQDYDFLVKELEREGIPYLAVNMLGFGNNATNLLKNTRYQDWFYRALESYDILKSCYSRVSIVGHSMGGILAVYLSQKRKVDSMILSGPGLYSVPEDLKYKKLLGIYGMATIISWLIPYLPKPIRAGRLSTSDTCSPDVIDRVFQYMAVPIKSVVEIFKAQDVVIAGMESMQFNRLMVLYGKNDLTTDNIKFLKKLDSLGYNFEAHELARTAHNCYEDYDKSEAIRLTLEFLCQGSKKEVGNV